MRTTVCTKQSATQGNHIQNCVQWTSTGLKSSYKK